MLLFSKKHVNPVYSQILSLLYLAEHFLLNSQLEINNYCLKMCNSYACRATSDHYLSYIKKQANKLCSRPTTPTILCTPPTDQDMNQFVISVCLIKRVTLILEGMVK